MSVKPIDPPLTKSYTPPAMYVVLTLAAIIGIAAGIVGFLAARQTGALTGLLVTGVVAGVITAVAVHLYERRHDGANARVRGS